MTPSPLFRATLLAGVGLCVVMAAPVAAQEESSADQSQGAPQGAPNGDSSGAGGPAPSRTDEIVVSAQRVRGQLDVEEAPLLELGEEDIAAEGVTSIADLITQISNRTSSARGRGGGGRPVILINGIRIGSFREFANYPPEALERVEVFPEEVAQRFGFPPDRRVINLILKDNYNNTVAEMDFEGPSRGGNSRTEQEIGYLQIADGARINASFEARDTSLLTEDERGIIQTPGSTSLVPGDPDQAEFRSLIADSRSLQGNLSWAKALIDSGIALSANANYTRSDSRSLQGLNSVLLTDSEGDTAFRTFGAETPLEQRVSTDTFSTSGSLTKPINSFRLTSTFNASFAESTQEFDRRVDVSGFQDDALDGVLALDGALPSAVDSGFDTAFTRNISASSLTTLRGPIAYLPGGEIITTFDVGYNWTNFETSDTRNDLPVDLTRGDLSTGMNINIPITSRRNGFADALGSFTLNGQIGLQHLSDFGTLGDYTIGLNWQPFDNLTLSATYIEREVAPGLTSLGNPEVEFLNVPVFDFVNGETVLATVIGGGNPDLLAETQSDWKFAANWRLPFWENTRLTFEYVRNRSDDVTRGFPTITQEIEAAFPDRITRDAGGTLIAIDRRPVTFAETRAERIQIGINTSGSIGAGAQGGRPGGGRPQAASGRRPPTAGGGNPQASGRPSGPPAGAGGPPGTRPGGPPSAEQRAAFLEFRTRICADDGMGVLTRLVEAAQAGEDLSTVIPGFDAQRFERLLARVRAEDGTVDPERLANTRDRICDVDPANFAGPRGPDGPPGAPGGQRREGFAAFRAIACADDGIERLRSLIARIDAGEDVSDELPGFDPQMADMMLSRLRDADGNVSEERLQSLRSRFCSGEGGPGSGQGGPGGQGAQGGQQARGGPPAGGFNPLARRSFRGFRYFFNLNHTIELENEILIAPGLAPLDQLDGQATGAFGFPRHSTRLEAGIFGNGIGMRLSGRYTGETRLDGSGLPGSTDIFFGDLVRFDIRIFTEVGELVGEPDGVLKNFRVSLRADNVFDAQREVRDADGNTPINYQPFLIDPNGLFLGIELRKLF